MLYQSLASISLESLHSINQFHPADFDLDETPVVKAMAQSSAASIPLTKTMLALVAMTSVPLISFYSKKFIDMHSFGYRIIWAVAMLVNFITVGLPGRFDSEAQENKKGFPWVTLFEPAGWAFAIWGAIYAGEFALTAYVAALGQHKNLFAKAAPFWLAGNLFQSLWCLTFRPEFRSVLWLPMSLLATASASFFATHQVLSTGLAQSTSQLDKLLLLIMRSPISLHAAWLAAATTLNLNGWTVMAGSSYPTQISVAFTSCFLGAAFGLAATICTKDPLFAGVIAWALSALASRTLAKVDKKVIPYISSDTQLALALTEKTLMKVLLGVAALVVVYEAIKNKGL